MKKFIICATLTLGLAACSNGDSTEQEHDSANTLQDTFPAGRIDSIAIDSNPADATYVDSLLKVP